MTTEIEQARDTIRRCLQLREQGKPEAVLRSEIQSALRVVFPAAEDQIWINHYVEGSEAKTKIGKTGGGEASRFIDNLIGSTTIEYESDLRNVMKFGVGLNQVKEHAAGLIRSGMPTSQVRGILSDTIEWYAYDVQIDPSVTAAACMPENVTLIPLEQLKLSVADDVSAQRLTQFIRKHLAREKSRPLNAGLLAFDLGLDSGTHARNVTHFKKLVDEGRSSDASVLLATDLWSRFIDYLEGEAGGFRAAAYADEIYIAILARLLSANILEGDAISSDDKQLKAILTGAFFKEKFSIENMVEQDFFGWLVRPHYIANLIPIAREIQRDLYVYDFVRWEHDDLFGKLMADFARKSQRKLLGQEWTPEWLARRLAERCLDELPKDEPPRIVDMCCGSGTILAEVLKAARARFGYTKIDELQHVATGFDIDPLSVILSKTTWVATLAQEIKSASSPIVIPIYHADSLFAVTPLTVALPLIDEDKPIPISLDGTVINVPHLLVGPEYRELFDRIVDWAYDEAMDAQRKKKLELTKAQAEAFLAVAMTAAHKTVLAQQQQALVDAIHALAQRMAQLAIDNRNGIWAFILRNTYRPGLLTGQFNGLVSNPPWLAMSALADNPYRSDLTSRAKLYGIRPLGQSFLHLELGTMHLLHAVDRYLKPGAAVACLVPGTLFNGHHHERFRQREYLRSTRPVALDVTEVWQVAQGTFKYPGAAIIGHKAAAVSKVAGKPISGVVAAPGGLEPAEFSVRTIAASRSAWTLEKEGAPAVTNTNAIIPLQGADLMPRTAVCVEVTNASGAEYRVETPKKESAWWFAVKSAKELKDAQFPGHVAPKFIHAMAQSENLLQFVLGPHRVPIALPALRDDDGNWCVYDDANIRRMGFIQTARRFQAINAALTKVGQGKTFQQRIDERAKLTKQIIGTSGYVVLSGAGGKHITAACVPASEARSLAIDQTLYWQIIGDEDEAWYMVGMLNSHALTAAISPFNPKGDFGERHVHTLPYRLMPPYDPSNDDHHQIATLAKQVAKSVRDKIAADGYLNDPTKALTARRRRLREHLDTTPPFKALEELCAAALGTSAFSDESED
jgi:hypothetical protein